VGNALFSRYPAYPDAICEVFVELSSPTPRWQQRGTLQTAAYIIVILACAWWLLGQWGNVLRPLLLAIFLTYVLLPWHSRLRRHGVPARS